MTEDERALDAWENEGGAVAAEPEPEEPQACVVPRLLEESR